MQEKALQVAFEIKTTCDEISRKLLRWHWEQKPGKHDAASVLDHIAKRQKECPEYYERTPDLAGKTSWQQLDTTLCMRVLLDPEKGAKKQLDLLGYAAHPGAARRACNAVRTARNEAAHAADTKDGIQAAILFNEAIEALEEGYTGTAFSEKELAQYYREAEGYLDRCGAREPTSKKKADDNVNKATKNTGRKKGKGNTARSTNKQTTARHSDEQAVPKHNKAQRRAAAVPKRIHGGWGLWVLLFVVLLLGLGVRAVSMGFVK